MQNISSQTTSNQARIEGVHKETKETDRFTAQKFQIVKPSQIPAYLRRSSFYRSLCVEGDNDFVIPSQHMKANAAVKTVHDLDYLLRTIRFWRVDGVPTALVVYLVGLSAISEKCEAILREHAPELKYLYCFLPAQR